jgi:hypothetical protein
LLLVHPSYFMIVSFGAPIEAKGIHIDYWYMRNTHLTPMNLCWLSENFGMYLSDVISVCLVAIIMRSPCDFQGSSFLYLKLMEKCHRKLNMSFMLILLVS